MTLRLASPPAAPCVRESVRVRTVAGWLDCEHSQVRRLITDGQLTAHTIGKRGVRVYVDSVTAYQERQARKSAPEVKKARADRRHATSAAQAAAMAELHSLGLL